MEKKNTLIESNKEKNLVRCPDAKAAKKMQELIEQTKKMEIQLEELSLAK
jgi:DNA-binding transcriptional regulator YhcF (GntR family)